MSNYDFNGKLSYTYWINTWDNNGVRMREAYSIEDAESKFNMDIRRCQSTDNKVVLTHHGYIFTGKSRYQAELALSYLKDNYPTYTNFRFFGTGEWDDPYGVSMEKALKIYDIRTKKICDMAVDDEK